MRSTQLLTIEEAARYLNVSKTSLRRWTNSGRLRCRRIGVRALRRFLVADLEDFLQATGSAEPPPGGPPAPAEIRALNAGARLGKARHVCSHFADIEESWRLFLPYFAHHASNDAPTVYIYNSTPYERFKQFVRASGFDPDALIALGLLELIPSNEAYLKTGAFSIPAMLAFVEEAIVKLEEAGHRRILISGEMTWSLGGVSGSEGMIAYEEQLNEMLERHPDVTIVCHYSMERFGAELTLQALRAHPFVQLPQGLFPGLYTPPASGVTGLNRGSM